MTDHRVGRRYLQKNSGRSAVEILSSRAHIQTTTIKEVEKQLAFAWTVYRDVNSGSVYICPTAEFFDGRFILLIND